MQFSSKTGATFSPPAVIISSLIRPVIVKFPFSSIYPTSPECKNPSLSIASRVAYSFLNNLIFKNKKTLSIQ